MPQYRAQSPGVTSRIRLRGHDYSEPGHYSVTMCINNRHHRLGVVSNQEFVPFDAGTMVEDYLVSIPHRFRCVYLDEWCLMPNHLHLLPGIGIDAHHAPPFPSLPTIMDWFKSITTVEYINGVKNLGWPQFEKHLWQPRYHDRVIRSEPELNRIRSYIAANPATWQEDEHFTKDSPT